MYFIGFYSPKEKSGVTETSLAIFEWLKNNTSLKIAFISNEQLVLETEKENVIEEFAKMKLNQQRNEIKKLRSEYDIIIYDVSSKLNEEVLKFLSILDRLFVLGEDNTQFAETIHQLMEFNRSFDNRSKKLIKQLQQNKTFILSDKTKSKVGFARSKNDAKKIASVIYEDYSTFYLKEKYYENQMKIVNNIKRFTRQEFVSGCYKLGLSFEKALLFEKYIYLREGLGQQKNEIIEELFPLIFQLNYNDLIKNFQNEIYISQIRFKIANEETNNH